ncbi:DNA polymerase III [Pseudomonas sp. BN605]|uniref:hypothetical protein n=1 Tax=Pseudomonas sp. BN605 TaxID=2567893 RepID=UPI0024553D2A|nr:hypothetical protein [Pseudomonas sp. BN605]MDH4843617.1 DNA polymerase III [Pseudomonas sp. BN605]
MTLPERFPLGIIEPVANLVLGYVRQIPGVAQATIAGSIRRMRDTVGDIDILIEAEAGADIIAQFLRFPDIAEALSKGPVRASVRLKSGLQVDVRLVVPAVHGAALLYFTGSKEHNIAIRSRARSLGLKLNEYGVFDGDRCLACGTEADVYKALGLPWIAPELRENAGELKAAEQGLLPNLLEATDLNGDLHVRTRVSGAGDAMEEVALAARAMGLEYLAIADGLRSLHLPMGLDLEGLRQQMDKIDALNSRLQGFTLLKGAEASILEDGSLGIPDLLLERLDLVVAAVHAPLKLTPRQQTLRLQRAIAHPCVAILAHPLCRLINEVDGLEFDMAAILDTAVERGCALELNAQPLRMDLPDRYCRQAKERGVLISVSADAGNADELARLGYGVGQARRAWLEPENVLNTRSIHELRHWLTALR